MNWTRRTRSRKICRFSETLTLQVIHSDTGRAGGISVVGGNGKIDINNTFDERLKLLETDALPMVRTSLFGKNVNRRFHD